MVFMDEPPEVGYVEKSAPRCIWYQICPERQCDGNGSVHCRIRKKGTLFSRIDGEYTKITFRNSKVCRIPCVSFLDNASYASGIVSHSA